jgi:hypothetical protein
MGVSLSSQAPLRRVCNNNEGYGEMRRLLGASASVGLLPLAMIGSLAALAVPNLAAASGRYVCTDTVGSPFTAATTTVDSNLYVPAGASCSLYGVTVTGNLIVEGRLAAVGNTFEKNLIVQGGSVAIGCFGSVFCSIHGGNFILGNAVMTNAERISLTRTTVSGNLTVVGAGSFDLELSRADGNVMVGNSADVLVFSGIYGGDVKVINSTDVRIGDVEVSGVLDCEGNTPAPDLLGGIHAGAFRGQCAPSE